MKKISFDLSDLNISSFTTSAEAEGNDSLLRAQEEGTTWLSFTGAAACCVPSFQLTCTVAYTSDSSCCLCSGNHTCG